MTRLRALLAAAFLATAPIAAGAQPATVASQAEARDETIVQGAMEAFVGSGFAGLERHVPALQAALARAPASYPKIERRGGVTLIRPLASEEGLILSLMAGERFPGSKPVVAYNVYGRASLLLGSYFNEAGRHEEAIAALDRGLALQPDEPKLITEKGAALIRLKRHAEALALYEPWLAADDDASSDSDRARVLRAKGFALTELERLDEAEAAYRQSLVLEPGHGGAQREIGYIQGLRAGRPAQPAALTTGEKARQGQ